MLFIANQTFGSVYMMYLPFCVVHAGVYVFYQSAQKVTLNVMVRLSHIKAFRKIQKTCHQKIYNFYSGISKRNINKI